MGDHDVLKPENAPRTMLMPIRPRLTEARCETVIHGQVLDENGQPQPVRMPGERALTLYLDKREVVTLMTLGQCPEALALGYLRNQRLIDNVAEIAAVQVDWDVEAAAITTLAGDGAERCERVMTRRTVTSGCGQGTQFGNQLDSLGPVESSLRVARSTLFAVLEHIRLLETQYKKTGTVHGCALFDGTRMLYHVEDIGRHNAVDSISGLMWLDRVDGGDKLFYTTGRLTSEMVIKAAEMGIPLLMSRSGTTEMGLAVARQCGITLVGRARNGRFLVFHGAERIDFGA